MLIVVLLHIGAILRCVKKRSFDIEELDFLRAVDNFHHNLCHLRGDFYHQRHPSDFWNLLERTGRSDIFDRAADSFIMKAPDGGQLPERAGI